MMTDWYERSTKTLQLAGLAKSSQESYTRMVRMLVDFYDKTPDLVSEEELQDYLLHRRTSISGPLRPCASAIARSNSFSRKFCSANGTFSVT